MRPLGILQKLHDHPALVFVGAGDAVRGVGAGLNGLHSLVSVKFQWPNPVSWRFHIAGQLILLRPAAQLPRSGVFDAGGAQDLDLGVALPVERTVAPGVDSMLQAREDSHMMKITLAVAAAAAALTTAPLLAPANAQGVKMAQGVDVQIGRDRDDRYDRDRDRRRYDSDTTVGVGPGGVTIGPRQNCRYVTTTVERDDGRTVTRRERRCD
jgi:hypothetical protein